MGSGANSKGTYLEDNNNTIDAKVRMTPIRNAIIQGLTALKYSKKQNLCDVDYKKAQDTENVECTVIVIESRQNVPLNNNIDTSWINNANQTDEDSENNQHITNIRLKKEQK